LVARQHPQGDWLTSTDSATSAQKFQRAFAAEFLCPIASLSDHLNGDYTEAAIEDAASTFQVSEMVVRSLLLNNGLIRQPANLPY
jgi:Zn-dependent peptidase ImmA (M78 family)